MKTKAGGKVIQNGLTILFQNQNREHDQPETKESTQISKPFVISPRPRLDEPANKDRQHKKAKPPRPASKPYRTHGHYLLGQNRVMIFE